MNLLIINDIEPITEFLRDQIPWTSYGISDVFCAYNADEARHTLQHEKIDILLCDIEMPGDDGLELGRWINEEQMDCDILFLTAHANFDYLHEALHLNCVDYILFPAPAEDIGRAVQKAVEERLKRQRQQSLVEYGSQWIAENTKISSDPDAKNESLEIIISKAVRYILDHISEPELNVNEVAQSQYVSASYLERQFKNEKNTSIKQYIVNQRMILAAKLLEETDARPDEICVSCGYNSYPYFITAFKKYWGSTPRKYRQDVRERNAGKSPEA